MEHNFTIKTLTRAAFVGKRSISSVRYEPCPNYDIFNRECLVLYRFQKGVPHEPICL